MLHLTNELWEQIPNGRLSPFHFFWLIFTGFLIGRGAGSVIAVFRITTDKVYSLAVLWGSRASDDGFAFFILFALALCAALLTGWLILNKAIRFGGAAWVQKALATGQKHPFMKILLPKFIGSWLVMAFGISVGREGPCIQMGASTALSMMRANADNQIKRRFYMLNGCSAGLAAAFSAPFTGICYVFEVMGEKFGHLLLLFMLGGSFGVYVSVTQIFGLGLMLPIPAASLPGPELFILLVPLGIASGLVGVAYNYCIRYSVKMYDQQKLVPIPLRPLCPFLGAAVMLAFFPAITGEGMTIFHELQSNQVLLSYLFLFVATKLLFTAYCVGSGIPAGLMVPILCLGGVMGGIVGQVGVLFNLMPPDLVMGFIVMGMAGGFAASERAPITALVLTLEMTGAWATTPGVLLVAAIASFCGRLAKVQKI